VKTEDCLPQPAGQRHCQHSRATLCTSTVTGKQAIEGSALMPYEGKQAIKGCALVS